MTSGRPMHIVAGVDFSAGGDRAADYAAGMAQRSGADLRLVHGLVIPIPSVTPFPALLDDAAFRAQGREHLDRLAATVRARHPGVFIDTELVSLAGAITLINESKSASLLVVGSRGKGGFARLLIGSVAGQIATYAACPVIVVPPGAEPEQTALQQTGPEQTGPVVVGVDGSEFTTRTLRFAFDEAARRGCPLIAVHVWCLPEFGGLTDDTVWSRDQHQARQQMEEVAQRVLAESLAGWQADYPQVIVERRTVHHDRPAKAVLEVCMQSGASLCVVGSRGRGGFVGPMLGSVSQAVLAHAVLPVAVVHKQPAVEVSGPRPPGTLQRG